MIPYVVRSGEHLLQIAARHGFSASDVWEHQENEDLRNQRGSMHILRSGDLLMIPEPSAPTWFGVTLGATNHFEGTLATMNVVVAFADADGPLASEACLVAPLPDQTALTTDAQGTLTFEAPVTLAVATVQIVSSGATFALQLGELDPVDSASGVRQRLHNLGFVTDLDRELAGEDDELATQRLACFQSDQGIDPTGVLDTATIAALRKAHGC